MHLLRRVFGRIGDMNDLLNVQALDQVLSDDVWCADHNFIDMLACQRHQDSFLEAHDRVAFASVITSHLVIPNANVEESSLLLGQFKPPQMPMMQDVPATLDINDGVFGCRGSSIGELVDSPGGLQEFLNRRARLLFRFISFGFVCEGEQASSESRRANAFGALDNLEPICLSKRQADIVSVRIETRIVTVCVRIAIDIVEELNGRCVWRISLHFIDKLTMTHDLSPLSAIEDSRTFRFENFLI